MSTRSIVGYLHLDGKTVTYSFHHWDGYPSHNGKILFNHYNKFDRVKQLVDMGHCEILDKFISTDEVKGPLKPKYPEMKDMYPTGWKHTVNSRAKDVSTFLLRDCGLVPMLSGGRMPRLREGQAVTCPLNKIGDKYFGQDFYYLFKNGVWYYRNWKHKRFTKMTLNTLKINH